jgi:hypothetical protein
MRVDPGTVSGGSETAGRGTLVSANLPRLEGVVVTSRPRWPLREGIDDSVESGRWVFTAESHRKRGFCCAKVCRHCPFGNSPADRERAATGRPSDTVRDPA